MHLLVQAAIQDRSLPQSLEAYPRDNLAVPRHALSTIASIATMFGLLGTVIGMIRSFRALAAQGGAPDAIQLSIGISEALINTALGLLAALRLEVRQLLLQILGNLTGELRIGRCDAVSVSPMAGDADLACNLSSLREIRLRAARALCSERRGRSEYQGSASACRECMDHDYNSLSRIRRPRFY